MMNKHTSIRTSIACLAWPVVAPESRLERMGGIGGAHAWWGVFCNRAN